MTKNFSKLIVLLFLPQRPTTSLDIRSVFCISILIIINFKHISNLNFKVMKKIIFFLLTCVITIGSYTFASAQETPAPEAAKTETPAPASVEETPAEEEVSFHQAVKQKFIEGGWQFMSMVLVCLIIGLAVSIERILTLNLASTNTKKLVSNVKSALAQGGVDAALQVCKATRGPVASIFTQGLLRYEEGIEMVEKSVVSYGSVEMSKLERGLVWISLFISLAPMLGFLGTVVGMIDAFDAIEAAGDISPNLVAGGIKVALITTVGGLIVAIILQLCYNYCVSKIDSVVSSMEEASISLMDVLIEYKLGKK
jgi:biopolymer transport protein ExbB